MANLRTLSQFKSALQGGGARPNLFEVRLTTLPEAALSAGAQWDAETFQFLCSAASMPASTISPIDVPFRGRIFKVAGDRIVDPWTITVINDEDFKIRTAFECWMNGISKLDNNTGATEPAQYMTNADVFQMGRGYSEGRFSDRNSGDKTGGTATPLKSYRFYDIFPTAIQEIPLSYDSGDQIEYFTVDFAVQYWSSGEDTDQTGQVMT
jgi:hypothetical protein